MVQIASSWATIDWIVTVQIFVPPLAALAAAVALFLNWRATKNNTKTRELDIFYKVFQHIQDLQDKYYRDYARMEQDDKKNWLSIFYNALECLAFLIRKNHIKGDFLDFYRKSFIESYEDIFMKHASDGIKADPEAFKEMKSLYNELGGKQIYNPTMGSNITN